MAKSKCAKKGSRVKIGDKNFTIKNYYDKKTDAKTAASKHRKGGKNKNARVQKTTCGYRLVTRG